MEYAIITPTFKGHFWAIKKYLETYNKYVLDKESLCIYFTISKKEFDSFENIIKDYIKTCNIKVLFFEDILSSFKIKISPENLLSIYDKFSFQTLKKFYTMLYIEQEKMLVLDSETCWYKPVFMKEEFINFFENPFIAFSKNETRPFMSEFTYGVIYNVELALDTKVKNWYIENFMWYYDKKILCDLFDKYGSPFEIINKIKNESAFKNSGIFEIILYCAYIYKHNNLYSYNFINIESELKKHMNTKQFDNFIKKHTINFMGNCGLLERGMFLLDKDNKDIMKKIFIKNRFNIIRCETGKDNIIDQIDFLECVQPIILAASMDHLFIGDEDKNKKTINNSKNYERYKKHKKRAASKIRAMLSAFKLLPELIEELGATTYYFILKTVRKD